MQIFPLKKTWNPGQVELELRLRWTKFPLLILCACVHTHSEKILGSSDLAIAQKQTCPLPAELCCFVFFTLPDEKVKIHCERCSIDTWDVYQVGHYWRAHAHNRDHQVGWPWILVLLSVVMLNRIHHRLARGTMGCSGQVPWGFQQPGIVTNYYSELCCGATLSCGRDLWNIPTQVATADFRP